MCPSLHTLHNCHAQPISHKTVSINSGPTQPLLRDVMHRQITSLDYWAGFPELDNDTMPTAFAGLQLQHLGIMNAGDTEPTVGAAGEPTHRINPSIGSM